MLLKALAAALIVSLATAPQSAGQTAPAAAELETPLSEADQTTVLAELSRLIEESYVFPDRRADVVAALNRGWASRPKSTLGAAAFAEAVTDILSEASHDLHLSLAYEPSEYAEKVQQRDSSDYSGIMARIRRDHHGYTRQEILPGNIRYVRVENFRWIPDESERVVDDAVAFLADGEAIILDLRGNAGGDPRAVQRLISYFFDEEAELAGEYDGSTGVYTPLKTLSDLPSPRLTEKPLYVLIDRATFSAGEEFAYEVQQHRLGRLVGDTTAGGANGSRRHPIAGGFIASIPYLRLVHPLTGTNWEGAGVTPDLKVPGAQALDQAMLEELTRPGRAPAGDLDWALTAVRARLNPPHPSPESLARFVGVYGVRRIGLSEEGLIYQRQGRDAVRLRPLGEDLFQLGDDETLRVRFVVQRGLPPTLQILTEEGIIDTSVRTEPVNPAPSD